MIRKAWYAVCASEEVTQSPRKVRIHGTEYVVYRGTPGEVYAFDAFCPHRGCDLSLATVQTDEIVCAFHGWRFNRDGQCTHIPANPVGVNSPSRATLPAYFTCEKAGLVWIYTYPKALLETEQNAPKLVLFPELEAVDWTYVSFESTWKAHFTRVIESVLDVSHLPFVHPETTGQDISPVVDGPEYAVTDSGIRIHPTPFAPNHPMEPVHPPEGLEERTEIEVRFPNTWIIRTPMGEGKWMCTFLTFTPTDEGHTDIFGMAMRNFQLDSFFLDEFHLNHTTFVMGQDQVIIESLRPARAPFELQNEAHIPSDGPTIRYRVMLRDALEKENTQ